MAPAYPRAVGLNFTCPSLLSPLKTLTFDICPQVKNKNKKCKSSALQRWQHGTQVRRGAEEPVTGLLGGALATASRLDCACVVRQSPSMGAWCSWDSVSPFPLGHTPDTASGACLAPHPHQTPVPTGVGTSSIQSSPVAQILSPEDLAHIHLASVFTGC